MRFKKLFWRFGLIITIVSALRLVNIVLTSNQFFSLNHLLSFSLLIAGTLIGSWLWDCLYLVLTYLDNSHNFTPKELKRICLLGWQDSWGDRRFFNPFESLVFLFVWTFLLVISLAFPTPILAVGLISGFNYRLILKIKTYLKENNYPQHLFLFLKQANTNRLKSMLLIWLLLAIGLNFLIIVF